MIVLTSAGLGIAIGGLLAVALTIFGITEYRDMRKGAFFSLSFVFAAAVIIIMLGVIL